jgi:hypothetical protein
MNSLTMKHSVATGLLGAASLAGFANAGFLGFVASVRTVGAYTVIDIYAGVQNSSDKFLNAYNGMISTTVPTGFNQLDGLATKTWKPDFAGFTSSRTSLDSFMTAGTFTGSAYNGNYFASAATAADPNFTGTSWNATPGSAPATTLPTDFGGPGWYTNNPPLIDNRAESLAGLVGRVNSVMTPAEGSTSGTPGGASANYGIWCAHLVLAGNYSPTYIVGVLNWKAHVSIKDGVTNGTSQGVSKFDFAPLPDTDGDGFLDVRDNCPNVPNPKQLDCNNNGIGDACEIFTDCNANNVPDSCDIAAGTSNDADANGVPDSCQADCNLNNLPDRWEISTGLVSDLNGDGIPDTCQGAIMVDSTTDNLGSPSGADVRSHSFTSLPYTESAVTVTLDAVGDLNNPSEWIDVRLNGGSPRRLFATDGNLCPATPDRGIITLTRSEFNAILGSGTTLAVTLSCPINVDGTECKGAGLTQLRLQYVGINAASGDCNGNRRLDVVETTDGTTPDCNGNKLPDTCDIANGLSDCNLNGVPDSCELATTPSLDCNQNSQLDSCEIASVGTAVDCDQNGRIDSCQVAETAGIDCNANLKPDSCDIASGLSADIDGNNKPDECQTVQVPSAVATIQAAIDAAPTNEMRIVMVAPGTYAGPIDFKGKPVIVRGTSRAQTILSGSSGQQLSVVRFSGGEPAIAALECVTVRGGTTGTPIPGAAVVGGGIYGVDSAANVRSCIIENNIAGFGGGAYFLRCTGSVTDCVFRNNSASADGGGFQTNQGNQYLSDVVIQGNFANSRGAGMHIVQGTTRLTRVQVLDNVCGNIVGGISFAPSGTQPMLLELMNCRVSRNTASVAYGGIAMIGSTIAPISMTNTTVCDNVPRPNMLGAYSNLGGNTICDCDGDFNLDGFINGADLGLMLSSWGPCGSNCGADLNGDGVVAGADLGLLLSAWGTCG